jgi:hypothetical protein
MRTDNEVIAALLAEAGQGVAFPAAVRLFCDHGLAGLLPHAAAARCEWPGASGGVLLAAAAGAAWAEGQRGGRVVVVAARAALEQGLWWEAADLCSRLALGALTLLLVDGQEQDRVRMAAFGWQLAGAAGPPAGRAPQLRCGAPAGPPGPPAGAAPPSAGAAGHPSGDGPRGAWPPVHLASLPPGGLPPWPWTPGAQALADDSALRWLADREARLLVAHQAPPWCAAPASAATLLALAQLAGEGLRVCWRLPAGALRAWSAVLAEAGRRGFALKLLVAAAELPALVQLSALEGWWVIAPADAREGAAVLAQVLDSEDAVLIAEGEPQPGLPSWPAEEPYLPGSGWPLASGGDLTLVCESRSAALALAARAGLAARGIAAGVLQCTSLLPLPRAQLADCALRAPLVVVGAGASAGGLAAAVRAVLPAGAAVVALGDEAGLANDLERIVRVVVGAIRDRPAG